MTWRDPIPRTTIQGYYKRVCEMSYAQRLVRADELLANPDPLVDEFVRGVERFSSYENREAFYSNAARAPNAPDPLGSIVKTHHVAWYLRRQHVLEVEGARKLAASYVDYEIAPARTTDHAGFEDGGSWRSGVFIDLLLANRDDRTPIVGELKIRADKDPFTALVQVLAGAAHLVTKHQYERLRDFLPAGRFPACEHPQVDCYILLFRFLERPQADLEQLGDKAGLLTAMLMRRPEIASSIRRMACVDVDLHGETLQASRRWCYPE